MTYTKFEYFGAVITKRALELQYDKACEARDTAEDASLNAPDDQFLELFTVSENLAGACNTLYKQIEEIDNALYETRCNVSRETIERWRAEFNTAFPKPKKTEFLTNETAGGTFGVGGVFTKPKNGGC